MRTMGGGGGGGSKMAKMLRTYYMDSPLFNSLYILLSSVFDVPSPASSIFIS